MIGLCVLSANGIAEFQLDSTLPKVGNKYSFEDISTGSGKQNRLFHAMVLELHKTGMHSFNGDNYADLKDQIKYKLGEGFDRWVYADIVNNHAVVIQVTDKEEIPKYVWSYHKEHGDVIRGRLKSWTQYTKKQRQNCIDNLISYMNKAGVNSNKYQEIMKGIDNE